MTSTLVCSQCQTPVTVFDSIDQIQGYIDEIRCPGCGHTSFLTHRYPQGDIDREGAHEGPRHRVP